MNYEVIKPLFNGGFTQFQLDGISTILNEAGDMDKRQLAYVLASIFHETGRMQPTKELGNEAYLRSKPYYPYYGRDLMQTTWIYNYEKVKEFTGIDVVAHPELIAQMPLAAKIAVRFMQEGWYTGKKLDDYFNNHITDVINARRIINGVDCAKMIADYYEQFYESLTT